MTEDTVEPGDEPEGRADSPGLPRHLAALIGALDGPADLARHHDKYLAYPNREEHGGAVSA